MFVLHDLYLSELNASRHHGFEGSGKAVIAIGFGDPRLANGRLSVLSGIKVTLQRSDDEVVVAEIESSYVVVAAREDGTDWPADWESAVGLGDFKRFALAQAYTRHRERIMEVTLRMGLPIFKLSLLVPQLTDADLAAALDAPVEVDSDS